MIIDDEPDVGAVLEYIAQDCGFEVAATTSAADFQGRYADFAPTAVVVDLALPDMDGIQLFRWLADQNCRLPVLIVSGFDDKVVAAAKRLGEARGLQMRGIITKPIDIGGVRGLLDAL